ncbi:major facilitator superfamily domain-containing protein [Xylariaceae sp. FL0804]|nr:major facilitator superfamily domain-containing protein [Xylariaceae sp. FL0804]
MAATERPAPRRPWVRFIARTDDAADESGNDEKQQSRSTWNMGMLNDKETIEVPGSVLLLAQNRNEPLGLRNAPARTSHSSLPTGYIPPEPPATPAAPPEDEKKMTKDGQIILDPQPDDSHNDPLNWPTWRRDSALLSLGLYCMVGGGVTPILAAGFTNVAESYHIDVAKVSLTTGLYMMGMGLGSVVFSPTAILYGKRPVYLFGAVIFILSSIWCAMSPSFTSLILARIFQGIAVSPVECLPSATIAEVFFLHERAFRIGIYTLLLLGGKNLVPLVSAVIVQRWGWRWVFWILAIVVGVSGILLFLFVPETFWDRSPVPRRRNTKDPSLSKRPSFFSRRSSAKHVPQMVAHKASDDAITAAEKPFDDVNGEKQTEMPQEAAAPVTPQRHKKAHVGFAPEVEDSEPGATPTDVAQGASKGSPLDSVAVGDAPSPTTSQPVATGAGMSRPNYSGSAISPRSSEAPQVPQSLMHDMQTSGSPYSQGISGPSHYPDLETHTKAAGHAPMPSDVDSERLSLSNVAGVTRGQAYTHALRQAPVKSFVQQLKVHHGRLNHDKWWKAAVRPFVLFAYPSVLWSAAVYSCSIGWLIVISESVSIIFRDGKPYHFGALATGLLYISPFIGGVLGTAVAGKFSDVIVKAMARRNGGLYEPEFRLVMALPVAITTVVGLMGFGWAAAVDDNWIVPTVFFGVVSFGCSLGSTTSITFCVDSYRQYAGEALVTLNFSKNIFHGLVFSLFVTDWLTSDGSKSVFIWLGVIQLVVLIFSIPMYIFGKRARMWTVRKNFMEKF